MTSLGVLFAFGALISWGLGDFFIQKATRKTSVVGSLFYICFASIFIKWNSIILNQNQLILLTFTSIIAFFAGLFYFAALDKGKIAIVEPILGLELPVTIALSVAFLGERLNLFQASLMFVIFIGIMLSVTKDYSFLRYHKRILEKGVILAGIGAISMGLLNFLVGDSANNASPIFVIWYIHLIIVILCIAYFLAKGGFENLIHDFKKYKSVIIPEVVFDNLAWISFAYATTLIPIAIATSISESYIALAVLLGIFINREKIKKHQIIGAGIAITAVIVLSAITG